MTVKLAEIGGVAENTPMSPHCPSAGQTSSRPCSGLSRSLSLRRCCREHSLMWEQDPLSWEERGELTYLAPHDPQSVVYTDSPPRISCEFSQRHLLTRKYFPFLPQTLTAKMGEEVWCFALGHDSWKCHSSEHRSIWGAPETGGKPSHRDGALPAAAADELG